jgi:peptide deformylase
MARLKIRKYGDSVLRKKTEFIYKISNDIKKLAYDMNETMYLASGVGLAAPQVGFSLKICIVNVDQYKKSPLIMINPKIILSENKIISDEGCLSFPNIYEAIKRFDRIITEYTNLQGELREIRAYGLLARIIQHELDHLDAKLFIDYLPYWKRKTIKRKIKRSKEMDD